MIQFSKRCVPDADDSMFQPVQNQCVRNAFEVSKPRFFGTPDNSWVPGNHTREEWKSKTGVKENYSEGLKRQAHWRAHTAQICTFFFGSANVTCGARDFFPRWVKIETCRFNWVDEILQHLQLCIADHHLQWCIGVSVPKEDYSCARVPYAGSSRYQCKRPPAEASLDSRSAQLL